MSERIRLALQEIGLARILIILFIAAVWVTAAVATRLQLGPLFQDTLVRAGMNGALVLALVPMVRAGAGLNFGLPLGIVCGLLGAVLAMEMRLEGGKALLGGVLLATPLALAAGLLYARLLEKVRGQEMMVGLYVGFAAVAGCSILWLLAPFRNPEVIWPLGGHGARNTVSLVSAFAERPTEWHPPEVAALVLTWLAIAVAVALFDRTRLGAAVAAAGLNPRFALAAGISVERSRAVGIVLSTWLAALGIVFFSHGYGFLQLYKAPLLMALPAVAALLLGGASTTRATVLHAVVGTVLFQALLTASLPVVNDLVQQQGAEAAAGLSNIPEIARLIVGNGVILYALTRRS